MGWRTLKNRQKIMRIVDHLLGKEIDINIKIKGDNTVFTSRILALKKSSSPSDTLTEPVMVLKKLLPDKGSSLIQSVQNASLEFQVNNSSVRCSVNYMGVSSTPPNFGFIVTIPESLEIEDKRTNERHTFDLPDFVSAEFKIGKGTSEEKVYELNVMDCSRYGLGLIIDQENIDLVQKVKKGTLIKDMVFYAAWARIKVNGIVQHISKIEDGKCKDGYLLGIESKDIIDSCKQKEIQD